MIIQSVTATPSTTAAPVFLGRVTDSAAPATQHRLLATARVVGDLDGWASLADAIAAVSLLTAGPTRAGAGIFELDGRFHARSLQVLSRSLDPSGAFTPWTRHPMTWLESRPSEVSYQPYCTTDEARSLRALVDGATIVRVAAPH
jgi:hypothetical protein